MDPDYCDSGEAYLTGLAVTDNPAVGGTDYLNWFSTKQKENDKQMFSAFIELDEELKFEEAKEKPSLFSKIQKILKGSKEETDNNFSEHEQSLELIATELDEQKTAFNELKKSVDKIQPAPTGEKSEDYKALQTELDTLKQKVEEFGDQEPAPKRPQSSGGSKAKISY